MSRQERRSALALRLLETCRNELMALFPHLDAAFACLGGHPRPEGEGIATDGTDLLFSPEHLLRLYAAGPARLRRGYLHMLLHCLFFHPFSGLSGPLWDLATDMAVEQIIEREDISRLALPVDPVRACCFRLLGGEPLSAEVVEQRLRQGEFPYTMEEMTAAFSFDSHRLWRKDREAKKRWADIGAGAGIKRRTSRPGSLAGDRQETLENMQPRDRDYRAYLRRFTAIREELELDTENFDPIFYHFGLEHYGDLPLIEPLEYKEVARLEELVIAIDTSGSCSRETVGAFLQETFAILSGRENFFRKMKVYLIQCDCMIQDVQVIRSPEDWQRCSRSLRIIGRGGTDFTPVFTYVEKLRRDGELKDLKALLYFTDGEGVYPREKPDYETAFVFLQETEYMQYAPTWAKKLLLGGRSITIT